MTMVSNVYKTQSKTSNHAITNLLVVGFSIYEKLSTPRRFVLIVVGIEKIEALVDWKFVLTNYGGIPNIFRFWNGKRIELFIELKDACAKSIDLLAKDSLTLPSWCCSIVSISVFLIGVGWTALSRSQFVGRELHLIWWA